jgi:T-complex protein 1 subunit alpha
MLSHTSSSTFFDHHIPNLLLLSLLSLSLSLSLSQVINNLKAGVVEPAMSKVKSLRFATEAAVTILRIDDFIKISPPQQQQQGGGGRR